MTLPLALTMGDPAGVGGELSLRAWQQLRGTARPFFAIDDPERLARLAADLDIDCPMHVVADPYEAAGCFADALPILPEELPEPPVAGVPVPANAASTVRSIERAVLAVREGRSAGVVTNPINKKALYDGTGFAFPGHTEFLGHLAGVNRTVMMLAAPVLRVVPVTIHIPLRDVCDRLTISLIVETARIVDTDLRTHFGLDAPRIAVAGLNPHAGEGGTMGSEDTDIVAPAIAELNASGIVASGPWPADTMFHAAARTRYDVALCMYHDQALIPIKALDFARGVNITLGLPFIRTSPDHGTAYDIAGTGRADPTSLIEALRVAGEMADRSGA